MSEDEADVEAISQLGEQLIASILANEPNQAIQDMIDVGAPAWYQNEEEGMSSLHAAAYRQDTELAKILLEKGAVWNAVDHLNNTAGDIALSFNDEETYRVIRDAGIRSELLLSILGPQTAHLGRSTLNVILREVDTTAAGSTTEFLSSKLRFTKDEHDQDICMLQVGAEEVGVMMGWERPIMEETVRRLCGQGGDAAKEIKTLNVGFGLGIIDSLFQSLPRRPSLHVIIEPHPDVLNHMKELGWYEKSGVKILEGRWQDFVEHEELLSLGPFDVVYTDTFSEDYSDLRNFFEHLPNLLSSPDARFSFFNGLGATNALFYDVYRHVSEIHLNEVGLAVDWSDVDISHGTDERWGKSRKYFAMPVYRLPICRMSCA